MFAVWPQCLLSVCLLSGCLQCLLSGCLDLDSISMLQDERDREAGFVFEDHIVLIGFNEVCVCVCVYVQCVYV
jgi:hypothetical protein